MFLKIITKNTQKQNGKRNFLMGLMIIVVVDLIFMMN